MGILSVAIITSLASCLATSKLVFPPDFDNNHRSSEIDRRALKDGKTKVFDYKVYSDTMLKAQGYDSTMAYGLIFPRSSNLGYYLERKIVFGNDSTKCIMDVRTFFKEQRLEKNSLLSSMITGNSKDYSNPDDPSVTRLYDITVGVIDMASAGEKAKFLFEKYSSPEQFKKTNGFLIIHNDSLIVAPIFREHPPMDQLQGLRLVKNDTLYAVLLHDETHILGRDILHLYTKASSQEQCFIAAFSVVIQDMF